MSCKSRMVFGCLVVFLTATGFTGCRIGNRIVKAADPTAMSGYYKSEPTAMTVCAFTSTRGTQCAAADLSMIPSSIQDVMTNPVYVSANTATAKAYLVPNTLNTNALFEMKLDSTGKIAATPYVDDPQPLWVDPACISQIKIQKDGMLRTNSGGTVGSFKTSGSVDFNIAVLTVLGNQCAATMSLMGACYQDVNQCPGATPDDRAADQVSIQHFLDPYLSHNVLTLADLPALQGMGWEVNYQ